jgi:hypothetical protein
MNWRIHPITVVTTLITAHAYFWAPAFRGDLHGTLLLMLAVAVVTQCGVMLGRQHARACNKD